MESEKYEFNTGIFKDEPPLSLLALLGHGVNSLLKKIIEKLMNEYENLDHFPDFIEEIINNNDTIEYFARELMSQYKVIRILYQSTTTLYIKLITEPIIESEESNMNDFENNQLQVDASVPTPLKFICGFYLMFLSREEVISKKYLKFSPMDKTIFLQFIMRTVLMNMLSDNIAIK